MKHSLLFYLLLLFATGLKARPVHPDKIKETDSLLSIVFAELSNVNPTGALKLATEALSLSRDLNYSKGKAMSFFYIGQIFNYLGKYEKSMEYLSLSEQEEYSKDDVIMLSEVSRVKGQVYYLLGLGKASFNEFRTAHNYAVRIKDREKRNRYTSLAYENLSIAYNIIKDMPDSSLYYMEKNEQLLATTDESLTFKNKINLYSLYGQHYTARQQYDTAVYYFNKALSLISGYNYPYSSWLYARWGDMHLQKGDSDSAMIFYRKGLENIEKTNLRNELPPLYQKISDIYSEQGVEDSARLYREKYIQLDAEQTGSIIMATEEALAILLREERKLSLGKLQKFALLSVGLFITLSSAFIVIYRQSVKNRKKMLSKKENEVSELKQKLNDAFEEVFELARKNDSAFLPRFREVYPEFIKNLFRQHPDIITSELQLCAMIFLNFSSKEIAEYMFITHRSVQTRKSRLRKKLGIPGEVDLYRYFKSISYI
ncbi:LuxR family transcriptional regulator [uncultured Proteiniphilum sp.]|uniref:LuxR family transcriptional regulator n=1 Tax=uncultured Proteiniphilum sp. TaxID=497637 RepID=UPI00261BEB3F|nr:LuxR family transcriptional regulator [uncultured Proteiniphilum sp.]